MTNTIQQIIELAIQIQQIPAPTFNESKRAEFVRGLFVREGLSDVTIDEAGNVYGFLSQVTSQRHRPATEGSVEGSKVKPLIVSAHMDTVFPLDMDLRVKREADKVYGIGIGDNSLGVAALVGLIWMLRERRTSPGPAPERRGGILGDIWLVANVCEEGLGNLRGMKAVVDRFGDDALAYLVLEGMALGHVYHRAVAVKRYRVTAKTRGGHSWSDYGQLSAIHELSKLVAQLTALQLPKEPRTTLNVGKISGGTSINVIASEAWLELDLRSEGQESLAQLVADAEKLIREANKPGLNIEAEVIGQRAAGEMSPDHPLIQLAVDCVREQGLEPVLTMGSTDANIPLNRNFPALVLGISTGGGAHTKDEYINTAPIEKGMEQLVRFVEGVW